MARKTYAKEVEDFAFEPIGARPNGHKAVDDGVGAGQANLEADAVATGDGNEMVVQLKAGLVGKTIDAGRIGEQVETEVGAIATAFCHRTEDLSGKDQSGLAAKLNYFVNRVGIPCAKVLGHDTTSLRSILSHVSPPSDAG